MKAILDSYKKENANLKDLQVPALFSLASFYYVTLLLAILNSACNMYIRIFVPRSKTDVYRKGNYVDQFIGSSILSS